MPVATVDEYLSALEKSKLLAAEQLAQAQSLAGGSSDAPSLARALARENIVSRWQAGTLLALGQRAQLRLGKYKLIERLGKGGMGTVFLAEHVTMNRRVALKIVPRAVAQDRASLDRFFAEARAIAALDHPNIVQAYSVDNEMDRYFIVMEYVDGQDLQRTVEVNGKLEFERAADFIRQAADGLAHAHARNLVHCDIKPSNLLVNNQGVVKILDLGLARLNRSEEPRGAASGESAFGTVDYMAPEQGLGTNDFDHRADIYSLGCTLYFLLTGHPPFPEGSIAQRIAKHQMQEPKDILAERPGTPPKLVEICKRMMAKQPEDRYQSVQEVSVALAPLAGGPAAASPAAPRAVKLLDEAASNGNGAPSDWLSGLTRPASSAAQANGAAAIARIGATTTFATTGKQGKKARSSGGGTAFAGIATFSRAKLSWFNTTKRKVIGGVAATVVLAAIAGLAALPFILSQPKPPPAPQAKTEEKPANTEPEAAKPIDSSAEKPRAIVPIPELLAQSPTKSSANPVVAAPPQPAPKPPENQTPDKPKPKTDKPAKPTPPPVATPTPKVVEKQVSFADLKPFIDLPNKDSESESLGKLDLPPKAKLEVALLGGDTIAKGNPKFELQPDGDDNSTAWSITMTEKNKDAVKLARVYLEGGECKFQWTVEPKDKASLLRFCGLQFSTDAKVKPHFTALMEPKTVQPLAIDSETAAARPKPVIVSRDFLLCDPSLLRLQIRDLDKSMPKHHITVLEKARPSHSPRGKTQEIGLGEPVAGDTVGVKGHAFVKLTKDKMPAVTFQIGFDARGKEVLLTMQGFCEISGNTIPFAAAQGALAGYNLVLMMNENKAKNAHKPQPEAVQAAKTGKEQIKALGDLIGELNQKASIPFRVYVNVGGGENDASHEVVIFQSGKEAPKSTEPKKKNKASRQNAGRIQNKSDE